ncbi:hypothetical protein DFP72DRAFT_853675 [Ephemerocybe angulata]|uniref:Ubiquitin-like domain-containing protein n=1 Tax=Ephemerocybe angulata TaxID=980116 RepID=A0A8H6M0X0_9AGAR|nr:hypothetical protein DFP72DRAFT_853675 [Tulosesus angulatus]
MPASRTSPLFRVSTEKNVLYTTRLVLQHKMHKVLVKLSPNYNYVAGGLYRYLQEQAIKLFPDVGNDHATITFWSSELPDFEGEEVEISEFALPGLEDVIRRLVVKVRPDVAHIYPRERVDNHQCPSATPSAQLNSGTTETASFPSGNEWFQIRVGVYDTSTKQRVEVRCTPDTKISKFMESVEAAAGIPYGDQVWTYNNHKVLPDATLSGLLFRDNDTLHLARATTRPLATLKFGKPVIYLYPTTTTRISTTLSIVPEWEFSAIYPVVPAKNTEAGQELKWVVDAEPSGTLTEVGTGLKVSYLYWEADTIAKGLMSPLLLSPGSPGKTTVLDDARFTPNQASLDSKDTVLVEVAKITPYLDDALKALGLHVEARTSFITYWLPSLLKNEYVALRFLPQSAYEKAARLTVEPVPDVVARIFMLFKGVGANDLGVWSEAGERAKDDVGHWTDVVGVDLEKVRDAGLFRVIEWGGMEVFN